MFTKGRTAPENIDMVLLANHRRRQTAAGHIHAGATWEGRGQGRGCRAPAPALPSNIYAVCPTGLDRVWTLRTEFGVDQARLVLR